jgi:hypothetical protein
MTSNDPNDYPEEIKHLGVNDRQIPVTPERHGCVTTWLIFVLIANSLTCLFYIFEDQLMEKTLKISSITVGFIVIIGILNVVFSIMLLLWKKTGFYGYCITTIVLFVMNICIKLPIVPTVLGLFGIVILYGILQIKGKEVSAWNNLK